MGGRLVRPDVRYRDGFLEGEVADCAAEGVSPEWLEGAVRDFTGFVAERREVRVRWGVPSSTFWWVEGDDYVGTVIVRHRLSPDLLLSGGHVGYHVLRAHRRRGHATRMLGAGLGVCRGLGMERALVTCDASNVGSRTVIIANGGVAARAEGDELRFWIAVG